ncbi:MAG: dimethyl sulfoxide reductase anchor subunit family protein, partial [Pseudomonadota bacterium]
MRPAFSVIFLTTLIGAGQGLYLMCFAAQLAGVNGEGTQGFLFAGAGLSLLLTGLGLVASFFHLGHPERAWRAAAMWRTSWLSREVIVLPLFMAGVFAWGLAQALGLAAWVVLVLGTFTALACVALFVCTAMIYASLRFLQEWATPLTLLNYALLGTASGATLATALAAALAPALVAACATAALAFTAAGLLARGASLVRNARLKPRSTLQSAIGIRHPRIVQRSQGFMGGSFNTREFFHGRSAHALRGVKWGFLLLGFALPMALLAAGLSSPSLPWFAAAFALQYLGLLAERWF